MKSLILLLALGVSTPALSQEDSIFSRYRTGTEIQISAPAAPEESAANTEVIYFGGYGATDAQVTCWAGGVKGSSENVTAIQYPPGAPSGLNRAVERLPKYKKLLQDIKANPNRKFKVAGHSSGSQYANNLVEWMLDNGVPAANIELSNLDGFKASSSLRAKVKWQCWSATNGRINSNNYSTECKILKTNRCQTKWCLHFMLVNSEAPNDLSGGGDFIRRGYARSNCQSPRDWIESSPTGRRTGPQTPARR